MYHTSSEKKKKPADMNHHVSRLGTEQQTGGTAIKLLRPDKAQKQGTTGPEKKQEIFFSGVWPGRQHGADPAFGIQHTPNFQENQPPPASDCDARYDQNDLQ